MHNLALEPVTMATFREGIRDFYESAVKAGVPVPVSRAHDTEVGIMISAEALLDATGDLRFTPEVRPEGSQIGVWLPQLEIYGIGDTAREAEQDLLEEVRQYTFEYFTERYWTAPDRHAHYLHVLRVYAADLLGRLESTIFEPVTATG